jgi:hypothetical protein
MISITAYEAMVSLGILFLPENVAKEFSATLRNAFHEDICVEEPCGSTNPATETASLSLNNNPKNQRVEIISATIS